MIDISTLAKDLQDKLNFTSNITGFNFKIFTDTGKFKRATRSGNKVTEYTNGVLKVLTSDVSNLTDGSLFATINANLQVILRLNDIENSIFYQSPNMFDISTANFVEYNSTYTKTETGVEITSTGANSYVEYSMPLSTGQYTISANTNGNIGVVINGVEIATAPTENKPIVNYTFNIDVKSLVTFRFYGSAEDIMLNVGGYVPFFAFNTVDLLLQGNAEKVQSLRSLLDGVFQNNTLAIIQDKDGKNYTVSAVYQFADTGIRDQAQILGDSFTFSISIIYMVVQNGVNTRDFTFIFDGLTFGYQSMTLNRVSTVDGYVFANTKNGAVKTLASQSQFLPVFELPALQDSNVLFNKLFNGKLNQAHILNIYLNGEWHDYLVTITEIRAVGELIKNVGFSVSMAESPDDYELVNFGSNYFIYQANASGDIMISQTASIYNFGSGLFTTKRPNDNDQKLTVSNGDYVVSTVSLEDTALTEIPNGR